jgi:opine dehydrogenase
MKISVLGHSPLNIAPTVAADLALRGLEVAWWPAPSAVRQTGRIEVRRGELLDAARSGYARVLTPENAADLLRHADAVIVDIPMDKLLPELAQVVGHLAPGALVHVQSHGYWPASRLAHAFGGRGLIFSDSSAPTHAGSLDQGALTVHVRRQRLRFSSIGGDALPRLQRLYPGAELAENPLETGLEGLNLRIHPGATMANLGALDRAVISASGFGFYAEGNTPSAARIAEVLDAERGAVCQAWGIRYRRLQETLREVYGARGSTLCELIADCPFYASLGALPATAPAGWARGDLTYALVPVISLAQARKVPVPMHEAAVTTLSCAFDIDPWSQAPTLTEIGAIP